jgi:hypothetical protein
MAAYFNPYLSKLPEAQCVHGELHLGNVIFTLDREDVVLTDFEETPDAWFPPSFDFAYVAHRFCMDHAGSKDVFYQRLTTFERVYGPLPPDLGEMMRQVAWYNIALIIDRSVRRESTVPDGECDKFVKLETLSRMLMDGSRPD